MSTKRFRDLSLSIRPEGIESLEGVVDSAKPNATVTMPAAWMRELLAYVRELEAAATKVAA